MKPLAVPGLQTWIRTRAVPGLVAGAFAATAVSAADTQADMHGVLNPSEYTLQDILMKVETHQLTDIECIYGYEAAKHGRYPPARVILNYCAGDKELPQAMTLLSWMDENGYGLDTGPDLVSAAAWDQRAAEMGDSNAQFNYGVKLMIGRGVDVDADAGRRFVDMAAANGDHGAILLVAANYDTSAVVGLTEERLGGRYPHHHHGAAAAEKVLN